MPKNILKRRLDALDSGPTKKTDPLHPVYIVTAFDFDRLAGNCQAYFAGTDSQWAELDLDGWRRLLLFHLMQYKHKIIFSLDKFALEDYELDVIGSDNIDYLPGVV